MKSKLFKVLLFVTYLIILFVCLDISFENDTFYSIKIGQYILDFGIDMKDHYSWIANLDYTYPHWLFDFIVGIVYNLFSFKGIYILTYILYFFVGFCLYYSFKKLNYNSFLSYVMMIFVIIVIKNFATCRAQLISYSLIVLFYYNLLKLIKTNEKKYIIFLSIISIILVNCHVAVWPFLLILFIPFFVSKLVELIVIKKKINLNLNFEKINIKLLFITFIIIILTGFLTPLGLVPFTYLFKTISGVSQYYIGEHQPITIWKYKFLILYIFLFIFVVHKKNIKLSDLFLILGLSIMMLSSIRHQTLFVLITSFLFLKYFDNSKLKKIEFKKYKYFYNIVCVSSIILLIWYPCLYINKDKLKKNFISDNYPVEAVKYIKNNLDYKNMKIYNNYNYGSYLLFNNIKVMFDSRADLYTKEFNGKYEYFEEFMLVGTNYKEIFEKYDIDYALVYKDSTIDICLSFDSDYKEVYNDEKFVIYVEI